MSEEEDFDHFQFLEDLAREVVSSINDLYPVPDFVVVNRNVIAATFWNKDDRGLWYITVYYRLKECKAAIQMWKANEGKEGPSNFTSGDIFLGNPNSIKELCGFAQQRCKPVMEKGI